MSRLPDLPGSGWRALLGVARRAERSVALVMAGLLTVVSFAAAAAPLLLNDAESASLERAIGDAPGSARRLSIQAIDEFPRGASDDPLGEQRARLAEVAAEVDDALLSRFGPPRLVADTSRFQVDGVGVAEDPANGQLADPIAPALPTFLTFRVHPDLADHSRIVDGRAPASTDRVLGGLRVFEFDLTPAAAAELGLSIGDRVLLDADATDLVTRQHNGSLPDAFVAELVGLRELDDESDPYWFGDPRLHRPTIADTNAGANVFAFGSIVPDQLPTRPFVVDAISPFTIEDRRDLVEGSVDLGTVDATLDGLVSLGATFSQQPTPTRPGVLAGLGPVLQLEVDQRETARTTLLVAAVGTFGVVVTTLGQMLVASFGRRRGWLTVARARGASRGQVVAGAMAEMAAIAGVAVVAGGVAAAALVGGAWSTTGSLLLAALWVGAIAAGGAIAMSEGMRPVTVTARASAHPGLGRWGRIAGVLLVAVAGAAVITFRRRGLAVGTPSPDLLVLLVPVLVPLAAVYLTRWVLPMFLRQIARRGMALGPGRLVGLRRVITSPDVSVGVITVLALALTVSAVGLGVNRSLERGAVDASWVEVGAPYRLSAREPSIADEVRALPGAVVSASGNTRVNLGRDESAFNVQLITVDIASIDALTAGTAADQRYPSVLTAVDADGRIPVIASERMSGERVRPGEVLEGAGARVGQSFVVVETRAEAFGRRSDWVVADRATYGTATGVEPAFSALAIGVPDSERAALESIAADADEALAVRTDALDVQRTDPLGRVVRIAYLAAAALAILLAMSALVAIAVVTARQRRREVAILGLLGAGRREITRAVAAELVPSVVAGVVAGTVVGWVVVRFYDGRYDLSSFAGGNAVSIRPDVAPALVVSALLALACVGLIVALVRRIVHAPVGEILRIDGAA